MMMTDAEIDQPREQNDAAAKVPTGAFEFAGTVVMIDDEGKYVPLSVIKPERLLEDQTVRKILDYAGPLSAQISRFQVHTLSDVETYLELLSEKYGVRRGHRKGKGNVELKSYDGLLKVVVQVQDRLTFGPELQIAKTLVDECIASWSENADDKVRVLVDHAFQVDKVGRINRAALFNLRRLNMQDEAWTRAMEALQDAIRVEGSKEYVRFYRRLNVKAKWEAVTIDLAAA